MEGIEERVSIARRMTCFIFPSPFAYSTRYKDVAIPKGRPIAKEMRIRRSVPIIAGKIEISSP